MVTNRGAESNHIRKPFQNVWRNGLTTVVIVLTSWLGHLVAIPPGNITTVWFPVGIAFAVLLIWGYRIWPGIWAGAFLAHFGSLIAGGVIGVTGFTVLSAAIIASVIVTQDVLGVYLITRYTGTRDPFRYTRTIFAFIVISILVTGIAPLAGSVYLLLIGLIAPEGSLYALWSWYLGNLAGVIVTTPFIVIWARPFPVKPGKLRMLEAALFFVLFYMVNLLVFSSTFQVGTVFFTLKYLLIPFILWAAFRFGQRGVVTFSMLMTGFALLAMVRQLDILEPHLVNEALWFWQLFICISSVTGLLLSAALRQRQEAEEGLLQLTVSLENQIRERTTQLEFINDKLQTELRAREQRTAELDATLSAIADGLIIYGMDGKIIRMNALALDYLGYTFEDMQKPASERVNVVTRFESIDGRTVPLEELPGVRALRGETVIGVTLRLYPPHRDPIWIYNSAAPIRIAGNGIVGVVATFVDITDQIRSQQERERLLDLARQRAAELDAALASVADGLIVYSADKRIARMNERAEAMLGYTEEDMRKLPEGRIGPILNLFKPDGQPFTLEETPVMRAFRGETVTGIELIAVSREKRFWLSASAAPIVTAGEIRGAVLTMADITRLKDAEQSLGDLNRSLERRVRERTAELEASNRELESFSYTVAHDLRAPLRAISGFSRIVYEEAREKLGDEELGYLDRISRAAIRLSALINDLLELARVNSVAIVPVRVDLSSLAHQIASELREQQPDRKAEFVIQEDLHARGDQTLLRTVLSNLMDNAWKYSSVREVARIEVGALVREGERVFYVRDNGIGFDMQYMNKLFVPFHRLHSIEQYSGTGIGLPIVQRILERHGGRIWAESEPGKGATFYFVLPL